jgi:hypothetical protein
MKDICNKISMKAMENEMNEIEIDEKIAAELLMIISIFAI